MEFNQTGLFTRTEALSAGVTDDELRRARLNELIVAIRPGFYVTAKVYSASTPRDQHLFSARAVAANSPPNSLISHISAALVYGYDHWGVPLDKVHLTAEGVGSGKQGRRRVLHMTRLTDAERSVVSGLAVTSAARTIVDLSRGLTFEKAVVIGDHALRNGSTTPTELRVSAMSAKNRRGISGALRALDFMSGRSESVGESRSRVLIRDDGLPDPSLNEWVYDESGRFVGRVDFLFEEHGVIGEFDGKQKYGDTEAEVKKALLAENHRANRLRELNWSVIRWDNDDLAVTGRLSARLTAAFANRSGMARPRGTHSPEKVRNGRR